jgi:hypothetical protein
MLSNAQSSSTQEITAIISEISGAIASVAKIAGASLVADITQIQPARKLCNSDIISFVKNGPYFSDHVLDDNISQGLIKTGSVSLFLKLDPNGDPLLTQDLPAAGDTVSAIEFNMSIGGKPFPPTPAVLPRRPARPPLTAPAALLRHRVPAAPAAFSGVMVFFPLVVRATAKCYVPAGERPLALGGSTRVNLAASQTLNWYAHRAVIDPQRDFLTNPKDTFTFSGGIITGHNYSNQSAAKTVVDTILAPLQAIIPSTNISQSTTVQTGGTGSQTTTSTKSSK